MRRVYLDLVGLPPTVADVDAYLADARPDAYSRLVDRLLASPEYGQRWARPWLDLARYADSNGFQRDGFREVWPYRDWVIRALNADLPYDEFTVKQIAGDLLPQATAEDRIATGFHRGTTVNVEAGVDQEANRVAAVVDRVNTTGTVWLGTTLECAQCHSHKYDPFSQREYYRLFAYFNNSPIETTKGTGSSRSFTGPMMELPQPIGVRLRRRQLEVFRAGGAKEVEHVEKRAMAEFDVWEQLHREETATREKLSTPIRKILAKEKSDRSKKDQQALEAHFLSRHEKVRAARKRLGEIDVELQQCAPQTTLVMRERDQQPYDAGDAPG